VVGCGMPMKLYQAARPKRVPAGCPLTRHAAFIKVTRLQTALKPEISPGTGR